MEILLFPILWLQDNWTITEFRSRRILVLGKWFVKRDKHQAHCSIAIHYIYRCDRFNHAYSFSLNGRIDRFEGCSFSCRDRIHQVNGEIICDYIEYLRWVRRQRFSKSWKEVYFSNAVQKSRKIEESKVFSITEDKRTKSVVENILHTPAASITWSQKSQATIPWTTCHISPTVFILIKQRQVVHYPHE